MKLKIMSAVACALLCATAFAETPPAATDAQTLRKVEEALAAQGYDPGPIDGNWTRETADAVRQAQKDREFEPSGQLDQRTLAAIGISDDDNPFMRQSDASTGGTRPAPAESSSR